MPRALGDRGDRFLSRPQESAGEAQRRIASLFERPWWSVDGSIDAPHSETTIARVRNAGFGQSTHAAPHVRDAPFATRRRTTGRPRNARPRLGLDDSDLHKDHARASEDGLFGGTSARASGTGGRRRANGDRRERIERRLSEGVTSAPVLFSLRQTQSFCPVAVPSSQ